ncbi:MAG: STAS domain-containing protein [Prevotella sp.]|nr:STAS domain-containing protein [Prevotella sp.]
MMKTTIQEQDGNVVAILEGSLDTAAARETEEIMSPLNDVEGKDIIIDCTGLEYISSAGLRIFLGILQSAEDKGEHVYIRNINDNVRYIFDITGFSNIFEFI